MFQLEIVNILLTAILPIITAALTAIIFRSRNRAEINKLKAEVKEAQANAENKEIVNDNAIMDLYKRVHIELSATLKTEYDKVVAEQGKLKELVERLSDENQSLTKAVSRLERALKNVSKCPHAKDCPITDELNHTKEKDKK